MASISPLLQCPEQLFKMVLPAAVAETPSQVTEIILVFFIYFYYDVINPQSDLPKYSRGDDY